MADSIDSITFTNPFDIASLSGSGVVWLQEFDGVAGAGFDRADWDIKVVLTRKTPVLSGQQLARLRGFRGTYEVISTGTNHMLLHNLAEGVWPNFLASRDSVELF